MAADLKTMMAIRKPLLGQYASQNAPYMVAIRWPNEGKKGTYYMPVSNHSTKEAAKKKAVRVKAEMEKKGWTGKVVIKPFFSKAKEEE